MNVQQLLEFSLSLFLPFTLSLMHTSFYLFYPSLSLSRTHISFLFILPFIHVTQLMSLHFTAHIFYSCCFIASATCYFHYLKESGCSQHSLRICITRRTLGYFLIKFNLLDLSRLINYHPFLLPVHFPSLLIEVTQLHSIFFLSFPRISTLLI